MTNTTPIHELVSLLGREAAEPLVVEALTSENPAEVLAEYLAEAWALYLGGGGGLI